MKRWEILVCKNKAIIGMNRPFSNYKIPKTGSTKGSIILGVHEHKKQRVCGIYKWKILFSTYR
jgi:hypothetical protein